MAFIATHADRETVDGLRWGVEPICRVLSEHGVPIAPSTYYDAAKAARRVTDQDLREERLMVAIARVHHDNYGVYGARKVWLALNRQGIPVARCTVERLMKVLGLEGARRGRTVRTTSSDPAAARPADLVERDFNPARPDRLWVADFTYCPTWSGFVYVAFVLDAYAAHPRLESRHQHAHRPGPRRVGDGDLEPSASRRDRPDRLGRAHRRRQSIRVAALHRTPRRGRRRTQRRLGP